MVCRAVYEWIIESKRQPPWISESQVLEPVSPTRKNAIVLVHGFAGSPFDYQEMAMHLNRLGFRVVIPRIPGQGRDTFAYIRGKMKPYDYIAWLEDILDQEERKKGAKPYLVGFSMGGTLSVIMAARGKVERLCLIAPFYRLPKRFSGTVISLLGWLVPVIPKSGKGKINDPKGYARYSPGSMLIAIPAFRRLRELASLAAEASSRIKVPTRVFFSIKDAVASYDLAKHLLGRKPNITFKEYSQSNHIMFFDYDKDALIQDVSDFFERD